jgi:hypothetical protein
MELKSNRAFATKRIEAGAAQPEGMARRAEDAGYKGRRIPCILDRLWPNDQNRSF